MAKRASLGVPRFVFTLTDTQTIVDGPQGRQALNIGISSDVLSDFVKFIPKNKRKDGNPGRTEVEAMLWWFTQEVNRLGQPTKPPKFNDQGRGEEK